MGPGASPEPWVQCTPTNMEPDRIWVPLKRNRIFAEYLPFVSTELFISSFLTSTWKALLFGISHRSAENQVAAISRLLAKVFQLALAECEASAGFGLSRVKREAGRRLRRRRQRSFRLCRMLRIGTLQRAAKRTCVTSVWHHRNPKTVCSKDLQSRAI